MLNMSLFQNTCMTVEQKHVPVCKRFGIASDKHDGKQKQGLRDHLREAEHRNVTNKYETMAKQSS